MQSFELDYSTACFSYSEERIKELRNSSAGCTISGQPRAIEALRMGMNVRSRGYNIFVSGSDGCGRHSAVRQIASEIRRTAYDVVYTYNFNNPCRPLLLVLDSPDGQTLESTMSKAACLADSNDITSAVNCIKSLEGITKASAFLSSAKSALLKEESCPGSYLCVNLVVKGNTTPGPAVLTDEPHPTPLNMFGTYSKDSDRPFHMCLTAGSALESCGGFLVLSAQQVIKEKDMWESLKLFAETSSFFVRSSNDKDSPYIRPVVPQLPVKIILIGSDALYDKLCETDEQFLRLFKISAEFDYSMASDDRNIAMTVSYLDSLAASNGIENVTDSAMCSLLRCSSRLAERRSELTARLSDVGDILLESAFTASRAGCNKIDGRCVEKTIENREYSNGLEESRIRYEIETGEMEISLAGSRTGVVNGLAVMDHGLTSFGTPAVISVSVAPGSEGIVNIEHEAGLSGEIHDKGLLILEGYLRRQYARNFPLSVYAGICFEQSYGEVDGDSASSSELFALLSAIGEIPLRQDIAVTGSVNQMGAIQAVGGINEKITGFFDICTKMGLTGRQGVIIPLRNIDSLILPERVLGAIKDGHFHIYVISTVDQGMEILTQRPSGTRNTKGQFPADSVNRIIENRLRRLYELSLSKA